MQYDKLVHGFQLIASIKYKLRIFSYCNKREYMYKHVIPFCFLLFLKLKLPKIEGEKISSEL